MRPADFNLRALYAALDAQRRARGLSWSEATCEIRRQPGRAAGHSLSPSTVKGVGARRVAEGDGVLQMLVWLGRTPESFVPGCEVPEDAGARLPVLPPHQTLRFDTKKLHAAVDLRRAQRQMTWAAVAAELGLGAASLTRLALGGRTSFPQVMRITAWLGRAAAEFTRASNR